MKRAGQPFPASFYRRPTEEVARALLGCRLVHVLNGVSRCLIVVETEAYLGVEDPAAHTYLGRRTPRVEPMWGAGGHAYVYTIYGLHHCFNVVTREKGTPQAVLIRAGVSEDWWRGKEPEPGEPRAAGGPGLFCRALGIDRSLSGASLRGPELILEKGLRRPFDIAVGARVGVDYAGAAALWPLRFAVAGCSAVTRSKGLSVLR